MYLSIITCLTPSIQFLLEVIKEQAVFIKSKTMYYVLNHTQKNTLNPIIVISSLLRQPHYFYH